MSALTTPRSAAVTAEPLPPVNRRPLRRRRVLRALQQVAAIALTLFMGVPVYLIALAAFSTRTELNSFPKALWPHSLSTETLRSFLGSTGVVPSFINSVEVGLATLVLSLLIGAPAGYAIARYAFRGRDAYQLFLLVTRSLPVVVLSIPLATMFLRFHIYDSILAVALVHAALALPTTALITASVFVSVPAELEEAALIFGGTRFGAFRKVVLPLSIPGVAASSIFTFVLSWNEILAAAILTLNNRTLPALVLNALPYSPIEYRFAGGFAMVVPSLLFILIMRRYLTNMWGATIR
jgi:multiple sugar transport system permease protein